MNLRFTLRQLEYFVSVGELGTIALAAERINVSSPSISAAISQLEAEFKTQLFVRHHAQGLSLTPGGRRFFNEARQILQACSGLNSLASDIRGKPSGPITVGFLVTIAPFLGPGLRRSFETAYPDARVTLRDAHQAELINQLHRAEIDLAVTYDIDLPADIEFSPVVELPPYVMLAQNHRLAKEDEVSLTDLVSEPLVLLDLPLSRDYFLSLFRSQGLSPEVSERSPEMAIVQSLVAHGYGYSLINLRPQTDIAPDGTPLRIVPLQGTDHTLAIGIACKKTEHAVGVQYAFEEHLRSLAAKGTMPGIRG